MTMESDWMSNLPNALQRIQLNKLAIPGSHNSGAYNLSSDLAPDAPRVLKSLYKVPLVRRLKPALRKWCECQRLCIADQLNSGIRYLDLRISSKIGTEDFYLSHALYGPKVKDALEEMKEFLENHTAEVIIIDFNHFYQMNSEQHQQLIFLIKSTFGSKLLGRTILNNLNLRNLRKNQKQVICIYQHEEGAGDDLMWTRECIRAPWPNTKSPAVCMKKLTSYMDRANDSSLDIFIVCQGILTPDFKYTMSHLRGGGIHRMTQQLRPILLSWLRDSPSKWLNQPNIVIHDFVDEDNYIQCVLELNKYRIGDETTTSPPESEESVNTLAMSTEV